MRTLDEAVNAFVYHPATSTTAMQHARVRDMFVNFLPGFWEQVPDGPEKTLALRKLQEAAMYANVAIALTAPTDTSATRSVARVLPAADVYTTNENHQFYFAPRGTNPPERDCT